MIINLTTPMSDDKERQQRNAIMIDAIEQYTEKHMNDEYGRIHTDGSRSGGQPAAYSVVLAPCPVPWCGSSDVKARSFDANHRRHWIECGKCNFKTLQMPSKTKVIALWNTRKPTQSDALREALADLLHAVCGKTGFAETVRRDSGRIYPWPALDLAEAKALEALERSE